VATIPCRTRLHRNRWVTHRPLDDVGRDATRWASRPYFVVLLDVGDLLCALGVRSTFRSASGRVVMRAARASPTIVRATEAQYPAV
jgi:hypothetical protein